MRIIKQNKYGFSLIELLVVVAIIGVLASILFAVVNNAREKNNAVKAKADLVQIMKAVELMADEGGDYRAVDTAAAGGSCSSTVFSVLTGANTAPAAGDEICNGGQVKNGSAIYLQSIPYEQGGYNYVVESDFTKDSYGIQTAGFSSGVWKCKDGSCFCTVSGGCEK